LRDENLCLHLWKGKDFYFRKEVTPLAVTKERKDELITQYKDWANRSRALIVTEYHGLSMSDLDELRSKIREVGGEFHIVKNTLGKMALEAEGYPLPQDLFEGSTAIAFAFDDAPATAKALVDFARSKEFLKFKGGYLGQDVISADSVKELADLPPLPVMRARLLGTIMAPANQLARVLSEPGRMVAAVIRAYADKEPAAA
jgi:large subunit ribosomal protein L10